MMTISSPVSGASNCLRCNAYRVAMSSATRAAAPALPPTVTRPRISVPSMVKNRRPAFSIGELYVPSGATSAYLLSRFSRGTRTWSNMMRPLSTPGSPPL